LAAGVLVDPDVAGTQRLRQRAVVPEHRPYDFPLKARNGATMSERIGPEPGAPCWVDSQQPDPQDPAFSITTIARP
jgi:hypothetical protein